MKKDIFDFEQNIMSCWSITNELDLLEEAVLEKDISRDDIANVVLGLRKLYELKFERLWDNFEEFCKEYHSLKKGKKNEGSD